MYRSKPMPQEAVDARDAWVASVSGQIKALREDADRALMLLARDRVSRIFVIRILKRLAIAYRDSGEPVYIERCARTKDRVDWLHFGKPLPEGWVESKKVRWVL